MNGSLPEKSEPLLSARYEPLAREAKMPKAQLSKAPAVSYCEIQLDILTKLAGHFVKIPILSNVDVNEVLASRSHNRPGKSSGFPNNL